MPGNHENSDHHHRHSHNHDSPDFDHIGSFLVSDERRKWQNPESILESIKAPLDGILVDIGCGPGFFTLPAALRAGNRGTVVGIDASRKLLSLCRQRLDDSGVTNAELLMIELDEHIPLSDGSSDFILMANVLHDFTKPEHMLRESFRILRKGGMFVDIDWKAEAAEFGPPEGIRFSLEKSKNMIVHAGFTVRSLPEIGPFHYCIIAGK